MAQNQSDPNAWSMWPPSHNDKLFGGVGAGLAGIDSLRKSAMDTTKAPTIQQKLDEFNSTATRMRDLAGTTSDPAQRAGYVRQAQAAERGAWYQKTGLKTLTGPQKIVGKMSDPGWTGQQLDKVGQKASNLGVNTALKASDVGGKIENWGPQAAKIGRNVTNGGINTAVKAGQLGEGLGSLGPNAGKLGQKVAAAGISVGGKAVDLGANLGPNVGKFGQKVATAGVGAGGRAVAVGRDLEQTAKILAPRLAQAGEAAGNVSKTLLKGVPGAYYAVAGIQAATDLAGGKALGRVAAETTGSLVGGYAGTAVGAAIGSAVIPIPVVGSAVGAAVGNVVGSYLGGKLGSWLSDRVDDA
ncbi:MAG TPA: hypothetical protein VGD71_21390, partial [Kribbella sp.]